MKAVARRWFLVTALALGGCLSPTLPLPPPDKPVVSGPDETGHVRLEGTLSSPGADVFAHNNSTNLIDGQRTGSDGRYDFVILAKSGDAITFWYQDGPQESPSIIFRIP